MNGLSTRKLYFWIKFYRLYKNGVLESIAKAILSMKGYPMYIERAEICLRSRKPKPRENRA